MEQAQLQELIARGKLEQAETTLRRERDDALAGGDVHAAAVSANDLGVLYLYMNRSDEARQVLSQAQLGFIEANDAEGQARALGNLARLEYKTGDLSTAAADYLQAADLFHETYHLQEEYVTLRVLSRVYTLQGNFWQGIAMMERALGVKPDKSPFERLQQFFYRLPLRLMGMG